MSGKQKMTTGAALLVGVGIAIAAAVGLWVYQGFHRSRVASRTSACIGNLRQIDGAKEQVAMEHKLSDGAVVTARDLDPYLKGGTTAVKCPGDSAKTFATSYSIGAIGTRPLCLNAPGSHVVN